MVDLVLENARHQTIKVHLVIPSFYVLKRCLNLSRALHQDHLVVVTDASLPSQTLVLGVEDNGWVEYSLELPVLLTWFVPVFTRAYQEQRHVWFSNLGRSNAHTFSFPETCSAAQAILAKIDRIEHFLVNWFEVSDFVNASLAQNLVSFLQDW